MKLIKTLSIVLCILVACAFLVPAAGADEWNKRTTVTFSGPVEIPGVGAQGATPADVARAFTSGPASALVNVARNVIYAFRVSGMDWRSAAGTSLLRNSRSSGQGGATSPMIWAMACLAVISPVPTWASAGLSTLIASL